MASLRKYLGIGSGAHRPIDTLNNSSPGCFGTAVGAAEFRTVENQVAGKKPRKRGKSGPHPHQPMASKDLEDDPIESSDELHLDDFRVPGRGARCPNPNPTFINSSRRTDGADSRFYGPYSQPKGHKRKSPPSDDDQDELVAEDGKPKRHHRPAKRTLVNPSPKANSSSLSHRGAIASTVWSPRKAFSVRVKDAVCLQQYSLEKAHKPYSSQGECLLRPVTDGKELRAFMDNNHEMTEVSYWLKIGKKINKVAYNDRSAFMKIHQANEDKPQIGNLMVLQFFTTHDASTLVRWMEKNLGDVGIKFSQEDGQKLTDVFKKTKKDIEDNLLKRPNSAHDQDLQVMDYRTEPQSPSLDAPRPAGSSPGETQNTQRVLLRDRMELSSSEPEERQAADSSQCPPYRPSAMSTRPTSKAADDEQLLSPQDSPRRRSRYFKRDSSQPRALSPSPPAAGLEIVSRTRRTYASQPRALRPGPPATAFEIVEDEPEPPQRWSETNPGWSKTWKMPLTLRRTTVDLQDIPRLDEGEFLNDNLLNFGLQWLFDNAGKSNPNLLKRVYMFNTFFYTKLKSLRGKQINYDGVKGWTSRVDLFSYDYIIVPVNEKFHWWLAIICNARQLDPSSHNTLPADGPSDPEVKNRDQDEPMKSSQDSAAAGLSQLSIHEPREDTSSSLAGDDDPDKTVTDVNGEDVTMKDALARQTSDTTKQIKQDGTAKSPFPKGCSPADFKILTLDSLEMPHSPAVTALKTYLIEELKNKKKTAAKELSGTVGMKAVNIPAQRNHSDCGVYVLGYMQEFVKDPDQFVRTLLRKEKPEWTIDASEKRGEWRDTILIAQRQHQLEVEKLEEEERKAKLTKITPPTPAAKKATQPAIANPKLHSSPVSKESTSGAKVTPSAAASPRPVKETKPASKPEATSKPPAQSGEKKQQVTIDLSSPVATEKSTPRLESGPGPMAAASSSRPSTADSPTRQLREFRATTPPKRAKEFQVTTPGTIGRILPSAGASTTMPKDDSFQEVSPRNFYRNSNARPLSHPPSSPPKPTSRTQRNHQSSSPPQSKSRGMSGWKTLQTGSPTPPPRPPRRPSPPNTASASPFVTNSLFALSDDVDAPVVRPSVARGSPRAAAKNRSTIDLTKDSMEIVEVVREEPGAI